MRIVSETCRRALSAILAAAMVLTAAPGTTMSEMQAEQTAVGSEEAAADDKAVPEEGGKTALEGDDSKGETGRTMGDVMQELDAPKFTRNPSNGYVQNGGKASFTLTIPDNSEVRYVIGEPGQSESDVKYPGTDGTVYKSGETVTVPAPESEAKTFVVVRAVAVPAENVSGFSSSVVTSATFTFEAKQEEDPGAVAAPGITFKNGEETLADGATVPFGTEVFLELGTRDTETAVYYTTDGTEPSVESQKYEEAVSLKSEKEDGETVTVKAIAVADGRSSEVATASIVFEAKTTAEAPVAPAAPVITLKNGDAVLESGAAVAYGTKISMELAAAEGASVYYTTDGTEPTEESAAYTKAVELSSEKEDGETVTVKAVAVADGMTSTAAEASVTFEASVRTVKIDFSGDRNKFTCKLVSEDSDQSAHWEDDSIAADQNSQLHLEIAAQTGFELKSVLLGAEEQNIADGKADLRFTATEDTTITVNVEESLGYVVYAGEGSQEIKPKENAAGTYVISPRAEYRIVGYKGTEAIALAAADLTDANGKHYAEIDSAVTLADDGKAAVLSIGLDLAGTTCKVVLKRGEQEEVLAFEVKPVLKKVTVEGVKNGTLTQVMGEEVSYALTFDPEDSEDDIVVECSDEQRGTSCSFQREDDRSRLYIDTANKTENLTITIYNEATLDYLGDTQENRRRAVLCEFTLRIVEPAWAAEALKVKDAGGTDTELKLSVTAPDGVKSDRKDYYIFEVKDPSTVSGNLPAQSRYFVEQAETGTKTYTLKVIDAEVGKGTKKEFQVKAYLVRMDDAKAPVDLKDPGIVAQTKEPKAVKCSTKNPYYADKISLKKGTTTVYSGQKNVQIATISFGKNTSYVDGATAEMVRDNSRRIPSGSDIKAEVVDGRVYADIDENTMPGKYTIRVKAAAPMGVKPAEASIVITVAAGLHDITLESESGSIYKAAGKAAKAKAMIGYDSYNQVFKPKNVKISYAVGSLDRAGNFTENRNVLLDAKKKPAVTVKNGSITISKDYQVKENPDENRFAVRVTVKSSIGVEKSATAEFFVSDAGQEFEKLIIIRPQITTYDLVLDADQKTYEASRLQGARVLVVRKGAQPGADGKYAVDDLLLPGKGQYTLTVKGVTVDDDNNITVNDCTAKNISFTAQAKDGSGNKVSLKIDQLKYDEYNESEVCVAFGSELGGWTELSSELGNNFSVLENRFQYGSGDWYYLRVMKKDEQGNLHEGDRFMNYSLAVSGGARILTDMGEDSTWHARNQWVLVQITGESATVTLKKGKTKVASYTMISETCGKEIKAPAITLAKGQKDLVVGKSGQSLVFDVKDSSTEKLPENSRFFLKACDAKSAEFFGLYGYNVRGVSLDEGLIEYNPETGKLTIPVNGVYTAGSGTLYLLILYPNDDGTTTRCKMTKGIRIKAAELKESFSMTKQYTISMMDARSVALQYKGNGVQDVKIEELYSENSKGTISRFWKTFEIGDDDRSLKLQPGCEEMAGQKVNGYIKVSVSYENGNIKEYESKVTVSVLPWGKTANKYTASIAKLKSNTVTAEDAQNMAVTISAGRNKTVPGVREVAGSVYGADGKETAITAHLTEDGKVALDLTDYIAQNKAKGITQKVIVKVLFDSAYRPKDEAYVPLQVTVSVPKNMSYKE